jgi:hypothetical protein
MTTGVHVQSSRQAASPHSMREELVCWTRMQAEGGQILWDIIARKELERRAGRGLFFWGVGNAPGTTVSSLSRERRQVPVVFSIMKSKPKLVDLAPKRTFLWRRYVDALGRKRSLPPHVLITSRGDSVRGVKKAHYALVCWSDAALRLHHGEPFDPGAYRNAGGNGARVGASQVTALLRRVSQPSQAAAYEANMRAWLINGYWVRLEDPLELAPDRLAALSTYPIAGERDWIDFVKELRGTPALEDTATQPQGSLWSEPVD